MKTSLVSWAFHRPRIGKDNDDSEAIIKQLAAILSLGVSRDPLIKELFVIESIHYELEDA